jgi:hypothetical protein
MARYDKVDPISGNFRARLADDFPANLTDVVLGVGLDANGLVVIGGANQLGVLVLTSSKPVDGTRGPARAAGDVVDVMTDGEITEFDRVNGGVMIVRNPGTVYYTNADGTLTAVALAAGVNGDRVGSTVEAARLVVRFGRVQG